MSAEQTHWFNNSMSLSNVQPPCDPQLMKHYLTSHLFNVHRWEGEKLGAQVTLILQAQESCQCLIHRQSDRLHYVPILHYQIPDYLTTLPSSYRILQCLYHCPLLLQTSLPITGRLPWECLTYTCFGMTALTIGPSASVKGRAKEESLLSPGGQFLEDIT